MMRKKHIFQVGISEGFFYIVVIYLSLQVQCVKKVAERNKLRKDLNFKNRQNTCILILRGKNSLFGFNF